MYKEMLDYNKEFVKEKRYEKYSTSKYPDKKMVILTCMDTRLTKLLPAALGIKNGDVKIIKNAGGYIVHPFGSAIRSLLVAIYEFDVDTVLIIGHKECGVSHMDANQMINKMVDRGIDKNTIDIIERTGLDLKNWIGGFDDSKSAVANSVDIVRNHPLLPTNIQVQGLVMDPYTGEVEIVD